LMIFNPQKLIAYITKMNRPEIPEGARSSIA